MTDRTQTLSNHARYVPPYHFLLSALIGWNLYHAGRALFVHFDASSLANFVVAVAMAILAWYARAFPLGVQDRVIRLEMRIRVERLVTPELFARFDRLAIGQVVALRFAGDDELPTLMKEALDANLPPAEIKKRVKHWRADELRI